MQPLSPPQLHQRQQSPAKRIAWRCFSGTCDQRISSKVPVSTHIHLVSPTHGFHLLDELLGTDLFHPPVKEPSEEAQNETGNHKLKMFPPEKGSHLGEKLFIGNSMVAAAMHLLQGDLQVLLEICHAFLYLVENFEIYAAVAGSFNNRTQKGMYDSTKSQR